MDFHPVARGNNVSLEDGDLLMTEGGGKAPALRWKRPKCGGCGRCAGKGCCFLLDCLVCVPVKALCSTLMGPLLCLLLVGVAAAIVVSSVSLYEVRTRAESEATSLFSAAWQRLTGSGETGPASAAALVYRHPFSSVGDALPAALSVFVVPPVPSMTGWVDASTGAVAAIVRGYARASLGPLVLMRRNERVYMVYTYTLAGLVRTDVDAAALVVALAAPADSGVAVFVREAMERGEVLFAVLYHAGAANTTLPTDVLLQGRVIL